MRNPIPLLTENWLPLTRAMLLVLSMSAVAQGQVVADENSSPEIWSVAPVVRPAAPAVRQTDWPAPGPAGDVDRFILAGLEATGFVPAPAASKQQLIRRVYFDLWGLPPSPDAVDAFLADASPDAYERVVDRLLAGVPFGERWGRYWLDVARYADTNGYERDAEKPNAWRYRDWVIAAHNRDLPYDQFIVEQLAGDEMPGANDETRIATGFLRVGTFDDEPNDPLQYKFEQLDDLMHVTATGFLALTLKCARCHDHKFDPIPQRDYYGILSALAVAKPAEGPLLALVDASAVAPPLAILKGGEPRAEGELAPPGYLSMIPFWNPPIEPPAAGATSSGRRLQLARWIADARHPLTARVAVNRIWQHHFGQGLSRTSDNFGNTGYAPTHPELLDWLAAELTAGGWRMKRLHKLILLSSAYQMASVHPRQAEYDQQDPENERWWRQNRRRLDAEAMRDTMLLVGGDLSPQVGGPGFHPTVDAEALEGLSMKDKAWKQSPPDEQRRRSVYMYSKRSLMLPLMTTFDQADTTQPCVQRTVSAVPPQALALLNNAFVHERSQRLAARVEHEAPGDAARQVERAWQLTLSRASNDAERESIARHLAAQRDRALAIGLDDAAADRAALESLCHVLLNTNEFLYVD